jgi:EAL domain-containing protein (putative c-di-GMP-specific phosphodiesterase class I)
MGTSPDREIPSHFATGVRERAQPEWQPAVDLWKALRRGELEVFYQPVVAAASLEIASFEALLRWNHPARGRLVPDDFIPVAEDAGLIDAVGAWVLRQACAQCATWPSHIKVAVNFSALQLRNRHTPAMVAGVLACTELTADRLEIEITESAPLFDDEDALDGLHRLRALGVLIAMDDFGTGYAALSSLPQFPFGRVKIDRCFLQGVGVRAGLMLEALAAMANIVKVPMTVEGVETAQQAARMQQLGCAQMQGFFFGRPMSAHEVAALIALESMECQAA